MNLSNIFNRTQGAALKLNQARPFSVAYNVKSKFEAAYESKMETLTKVPPKK